MYICLYLKKFVIANGIFEEKYIWISMRIKFNTHSIRAKLIYLHVHQTSRLNTVLHFFSASTEELQWTSESRQDTQRSLLHPKRHEPWHEGLLWYGDWRWRVAGRSFLCAWGLYLYLHPLTGDSEAQGRIAGFFSQLGWLRRRIRTSQRRILDW
jgi:hypothetical protein